MAGIIEAFYGPIWSDNDRQAVIDTLAPRGLSFYHYAPKTDPQVRKDWRHSWPDDRAQKLTRLGKHCHDKGMAFGLGLSPLGLQGTFSDSDRRDLLKRLRQINAIGPDHLLILFDDERGDVADLADRQSRILDFVGEHANAGRLYCCPTYFSDDPILDDLFGARPENYLSGLGRRLDPSIRIYWTGPQVCSHTIPSEHLIGVSERLGRKPAFWDNYPVNDSPAMIRRLHLRPFIHYPVDLDELVTDHAANPALQAHLSLIPLLLALSPFFRVGPHRDRESAFREAAECVVGREMAASLEADLPLLQDRGRDRLSKEERRNLRNRYGQFEHPAAREILRWLDGGYEGAGPLAPGSDQ